MLQTLHIAVYTPVQNPTMSQASAFQPRAKEGDFPTTADDKPSRLPPKTPIFYALHVDSRFVVVHKPADVRIDGEWTHTVEKFVLATIAARAGADVGKGLETKVRFAHRLDYATSGVTCLTKAAGAICCEQFERRSVKKSYLALVHGHLLDKCGKLPGEWTWPVADSDGFMMKLGTPSNPGRASCTEYTVVAQGTYHGAPVSKVMLIPATGRRHQLRLHAMAAGFPIVGDATYIIDEGKKYFGNEDFVPPRMMLHARRLEIGLPPSLAHVYGHKSARRQLVPKVFDAGDFTTLLPSLSLTDVNATASDASPLKKQAPACALT
jgi:tRNA pseudouridine32 synthase / 23S rRNA pseudouridine746 synthase